MMRGYLNEEARYKKCFVGGWYLTGDLAMRDSDGYYWFVGRADDVIKSSGHLIGPFEVESALMEHKAVAEAGVIGIPDPTAGEVVKAYVALKSGLERRWHRKTSRSDRTCRKRAAARSCAACSRLASSAFLKAIFPLWKARSDDCAN